MLCGIAGKARTEETAERNDGKLVYEIKWNENPQVDSITTKEVWEEVGKIVNDTAFEMGNELVRQFIACKRYGQQ